ncbi:uncharacterized protein UV8b_04840 [Ustilaginoidea virens]|uniref:Uncharacterized protein n=1 Tax=Ustilaginoidea virens TaxID=1159556 RepID=A0A8E5HS19_USTVR|nr:uncharacterized protein UV8b_04840 [Ustilaginoidea virens]QUC20599.1 hypothetical protein UV8b_04840 [Ustilaginoidea virens]
MGWESRRSAGRRGHENGRERVRVAVCEAPFNQAALPDDKFQSTRKHQTSIQTTRVFTDRFPASFWLKLTNRWPRQHSPQAYTPTLTGTNPFGEATIIHPDTLVSTVSNSLTLSALTIRPDSRQKKHTPPPPSCEEHQQNCREATLDTREILQSANVARNPL